MGARKDFINKIIFDFFIKYLMRRDAILKFQAIKSNNKNDKQKTNKQKTNAKTKTWNHIKQVM